MTNMSIKGWTDARVEFLTTAWTVTGLSAIQIADSPVFEGSGISRSGVLGKIHRLGLSGRCPLSRQKKNGRPLGARAVKTAAPDKKPDATTATKSRTFAFGGGPQTFKGLPDEPYVETVEDLVIPLAERKTIQTLEAGDCRWPIGDVRNPDFHFCGKEKLPGISYCEHHARKAFAAPQPRRRVMEAETELGVSTVPQVTLKPAKRETEGV